MTPLINLLTKSGMAPEFARFLAVGGANTGGGYLIYLAALWSGATPVWAYNISYAAGVVISYLLNLKFTFRKTHSAKRMFLFPLTYLAQYTIGLFALKGFLHLGVSAEFAGLLIIPITVPITFLCARFFLK